MHDVVLMLVVPLQTLLEHYHYFSVSHITGYMCVAGGPERGPQGQECKGCAEPLWC